jgi:hypothetical protein
MIPSFFPFFLVLQILFWHVLCLPLDNRSGKNFAVAQLFQREGVCHEAA